MNAPIIEFRQNVYPWSTVAPITYQQTKDSLTGISFPILAGENSDFYSFRIYNNFGLNSNISDAYNLTVTTFDNTGGTGTTQSVVFQDWLVVKETRVGEGASAPGATIYDVFAQTPLAIGGANSVYLIPVGSNASLIPEIRAGTNHNGCGFAEIQSYLQVPPTAGSGTINFAIVVNYDWNT